jgi:Carboxypeptidase regulatory-like domain
MRLLASLALCFVVLGAFAGVSRAEDAAATSPAARGANASGLCGAYQLGAPRCPTGYTVSAGAGYGFSSMQGSQHRAIGQLGLGAVPLPWLALSLELDGRIDVHPDDAQGDDVTGTGDPWLRVRMGWELARGVALGGELGVWLPGNNAPSFDLAATSVDLRGLLSWRRGGFQLLALLGARIDQSAEVAPDLSRLRVGDRISLGLSDFHALLWGVGAVYALLPELSLFAELSAQWLLGKGAPPLLESPFRAALGARYFVRELLQLELTVVPALSQRPAIGPEDPLVPIEPRISVLAGLRYTFGAARPKPSAPPAPSHPVEPRPEPPALANLSGVLITPAGAPLPDATVTLETAAGPLQTITDAEGRYGFAQLTSQRGQLRADAPGFKSVSWEVEIQQPETRVPPRALEPGASTGVLRCLVRSFDSKALRAQVSVRDEAGQRVSGGTTDADGALELTLPPGLYRVMIEAGGYRSQRTNVQVAANEVAILNVDMRKLE